MTFEIGHTWSTICIPAMHQNGRLRGTLLHVVTDKVPKIDKQVSGVRNAMVRPGGEMKLSQRVTLTCLELRTQKKRRGQVRWSRIWGLSCTGWLTVAKEEWLQLKTAMLHWYSHWENACTDSDMLPKSPQCAQEGGLSSSLKDSGKWTDSPHSAQMQYQCLILWSWVQIFLSHYRRLPVMFSQSHTFLELHEAPPWAHMGRSAITTKKEMNSTDAILIIRAFGASASSQSTCLTDSLGKRQATGEHQGKI